MSAFKLWLSCFVPVRAMAGGCRVSALIICPKLKVALAFGWVGNSVPFIGAVCQDWFCLAGVFQSFRFFSKFSAVIS